MKEEVGEKRVLRAGRMKKNFLLSTFVVLEDEWGDQQEVWQFLSKNSLNPEYLGG